MLRKLASSTPAFTRSYATKKWPHPTKFPRPKPGSSERPAYHAPDPLVNNPQAVVTPLPDQDLTFIHRPPPTAPSPHSLTTNPVSPLLRPPSPKEDVPLPPLFRKTDITPPPRASDHTISELRRLRALDPDRYTIGTLCRMFKCTPSFVRATAGLKLKDRRRRKKLQEAVVESAREKWSEKKLMVKMIEAKRKELW